MTLTTSAVIFAAQAHDGATRKGSGMPYIVHPMEVAAIAASLTDDEALIAAAVLHDVMEDCGVGYDALCAQFGPRVASLVEAESQTQHADAASSWLPRKRETVEKLARGGREAKLLALSDKLSNMRAIRRDYVRSGEELFAKFHEKSKRLHAWYYRSCAALIAQEFAHTDAYKELSALIDEVFADIAEDDMLFLP